MPRAIAAGLLVALLCACGLAAPSPTPAFARLTAAGVASAFRNAGLRTDDPHLLTDQDTGPKGLDPWFADRPANQCGVYRLWRQGDSSGMLGVYVTMCPTQSDYQRVIAHESGRYQGPFVVNTSVGNQNAILSFVWYVGQPFDVSSYKAVFLALR